MSEPVDPVAPVAPGTPGGPGNPWCPIDPVAPGTPVAPGGPFGPNHDAAFILLYTGTVFLSANSAVHKCVYSIL